MTVIEMLAELWAELMTSHADKAGAEALGGCDMLIMIGCGVAVGNISTFAITLVTI